MDLEKYKKTWENQPEETSQISKVDIYKMSHSKSSSIVKWILVIGILELVFWTSLNFIVPDKYIEVYQDLNLIGFIKVYTILHYIVIFLFLILFYKNYSSITITDSTKKLMNKILRVRKTVKYYVFYNLAGLIITNIIVGSIMFSKPDVLLQQMNPKGLDVNANALLSTSLILIIVLTLIIFLILWLFYKVTYGKLLKKLNRNYKELDNLDHLN